MSLQPVPVWFQTPIWRRYWGLFFPFFLNSTFLSRCCLSLLCFRTSMPFLFRKTNTGQRFLFLPLSLARVSSCEYACTPKRPRPPCRRKRPRTGVSVEAEGSLFPVPPPVPPLSGRAQSFTTTVFFFSGKPKRDIPPFFQQTPLLARTNGPLPRS